MNERIIIEGIGYIGSALVIGSMLMTSVNKLRIINTIGSLIFASYALMIHSYPTALINISLVIINLVQLRKLYDTHKHYDLIAVDEEDEILGYWLTYYREDILRYFPDFPQGIPKGMDSFLICCQSMPAGFLIGTTSGEGNFQILLDYTTPTYRDSSVGAFLYERLPEYHIRRLLFQGSNPQHQHYMKKMGFRETEPGKFVKEL